MFEAKRDYFSPFPNLSKPLSKNAVMEYFNSFKKSCNIESQLNLINRLKIRLGFDDTSKNSTSEELNKIYSIRDGSFQFSDWMALREEMEQLVIEHSSNSQILESVLVRYMQPFAHVSSILFPDENYYSYNEEDLELAGWMKYLSHFYGYNTNPKEQAQVAILDFFKERGTEHISDSMFKAIQEDLFLLYKLLQSMHFLAEIIQGLLFEVSAPFGLAELQIKCRVKLSDVLYCWKMAPLMGWTSAYCTQLMDGKDVLDLDVNNRKSDEPNLDDSQTNTLSPTEADLEGDNNKGKLTYDQSHITPPFARVFLSDDKIFRLGRILSKDRYTKRVLGDVMEFIAPQTLYAYMGFKIKETCNLPEIPWQQLLQILPHKDTKKDNSFIKTRASYYKKTGKFPPGYGVIDSAISEVFKTNGDNDHSKGLNNR